MILSMIPSGFIPDKSSLARFEKVIGEKVLAFEDRNEALKHLPEAEIIMLFGHISAENIRRCSNLKWIFNFGAGVEGLPFSELKEMGVKVTNTRGIHGPQMAEQAIGMMISFSRKLNMMFRNQQSHTWGQYTPLDQLAGKTLCIIGAGSIGREVAKRAKAFGMTVTGIKRVPECLDEFDEIFSTKDIKMAVSGADYIVLTTPLTENTFHLIGKPEFAAMKRSAIFINISRGDTVDEVALIEALNNKTIDGAGLDVFHEEPLPKDNPLWDMDNVVITPHNSAIIPEYTENVMKVFIDDLKLYREGKPMINMIDLDKQY